MIDLPCLHDRDIVVSGGKRRIGFVRPALSKMFQNVIVACVMDLWVTRSGFQ